MCQIHFLIVFPINLVKIYTILLLTRVIYVVLRNGGTSIFPNQICGTLNLERGVGVVVDLYHIGKDWCDNYSCQSRAVAVGQFWSRKDHLVVLWAAALLLVG
jgi:hypothetical protein